MIPYANHAGRSAATRPVPIFNLSSIDGNGRALDGRIRYLGKP
jgi:hypothetical protein